MESISRVPANSDFFDFEPLAFSRTTLCCLSMTRSMLLLSISFHLVRDSALFTCNSLSIDLYIISPDGADAAPAGIGSAVVATAASASGGIVLCANWSGPGGTGASTCAKAPCIVFGSSGG